MSKVKRKILSLIMTAAMITTLFAGMTFMVSADTPDVVITTQTELNNFLSSSSTYSGQVVSYEPTSTLTVSSVKANFAGTFEGNGNTINLNLSTSSDNTAFIGTLASTGKIQNISFTGTVSSSTSGDYVAAVVGYNSGVIDKVNNGASVTANSAYNIGGVAGKSSGIILNSSNSGVISGYRKIGGIVGENDGTVNSCSNSGPITGNYSSKNGVGGIAGLNGDKDTPTKTGHIWNCYNTATISSSNGSWAGGICGLDNQLSDCVNCYNIGNISGYAYRDHIAGKIEGIVTNCYGLSTVTGPQFYDGATIVTETNSVTFVNKLNKGAAGFWKVGTTTAELNNVALEDSDNPASNTITFALNSSPFQTTYAVGETFEMAGTVIRANNMNGSYAEVTGFSVNNTSPLTTDDSSVTISGSYAEQTYSFIIPITVRTPSTYYLDTTAGNDNNTGTTSTTAFKTLNKALTVAAGAGDIIQVMNPITISSEVTMHNNVVFKRYSGFNGTMFDVNPGTGNLVRMTTMRIDGGSVGTIFDVTSGTLNLRGEIIVKNGVTGVNVGSNGTLEVNKAIISASANSIINAGTLIINDYGGTTITGTISNSGTASMDSGTISGSTGTNGGGICQTAGSFTMTGGKISGNDATYGGGVYISGGKFTMSGGIISANTATTEGEGVYVVPGATFEYAGAGIATNQVIYLANTSATNCRIKLTNSLKSDISVKCLTPNASIYYSTGTNLAYASSVGIITSSMQGRIICSGYSLTVRTSSPYCIFISGVTP